MASTTMTAGLAPAALVSKVEARSLKAAPAAQAFGIKKTNAKVSCSAEKSIVEKVADAGKAAAVALASSALLASVSFLSNALSDALLPPLVPPSWVGDMHREVKLGGAGATKNSVSAWLLEGQLQARQVALVDAGLSWFAFTLQPIPFVLLFPRNQRHRLGRHRAPNSSDRIVAKPERAPS